jgi:hypothetical protein
VVLVPLHVSAEQGLPSSIHAVPFAFGEHVPAKPARLHWPHSPVHALSQHTPLAQNPLAHCVGVVHDEPRDGSWRYALLTGSTAAFTPPAMRTIPFVISVSVWYFTAAGSGVVSAHELVPFHSSALLDTLDPFQPPATSN